MRPNSRSTRSYYFIWKLIEDSGRENLMKIWFNYAGVHARATQYVYGLTKLIIEENKWQPSRLQVIARSGSDGQAPMMRPATVTIDGHEGDRHFNGIVTQTRWAGLAEQGHRYEVTLRPWCWLAGRRRNQRWRR